MNGRLENKVAIVTGAGASGPGWGNGKATAVLFAREGAKVFGVDLNPDALSDTTDIIAAEGNEATGHIADVTKPEAVEGLVEACLAAYGRIDVLHNNVGVFELGSIHDKDLEYFERVNTINMSSMFLMTKAVVPHMVERGEGGSIINLSSVAATHYPGAPYSIYGATKAAALGFSRHVALEYARHRIRSNAILPGIINTPLALEPIKARVSGAEFQRILGERDERAPLGRAGTAWDVAKAALFLASDESAYVTGAEIVVDGGLTAQFG